MEAETGTVIYAKEENLPLPPASVTKIMTLLLVAEAISEGRISPEDMVYITASAANKGGSQIFLEEGEQMSVLDLLKSTIIASANDAACALAELLCGTEEAFVSLMNRKATELGLKNTVFENCTGLDDTVENHYTSAYDIALMSRELIKYDFIIKYSSLWQDTIRDGAFTLTNTNRLVRYYQGCTGLKTGSTDKAGFCVSTTAKRGNMHLIAVIMGAETRDDRNNSARALLDLGFSTYSLYNDNGTQLEKIPLKFAKNNSIICYSENFKLLVNKSEINKIEKIYDIPEFLSAPLEKGSVIGCITYQIEGKEIGKCKIYIDEDVERISFFELFTIILNKIFLF